MGKQLDAEIPNNHVHISDLISRLQAIMAREGDLICRCDSLSHSWPPTLAVFERGDRKVLVLNG